MKIEDLISDEQLLLYHYREALETAERERIAAALLAHPDLPRRLQALVGALDAVVSTAEESVPAATFERWHAAIDRAQQNESTRTSRPVQNFPRWLALAEVSAVLAVAILVTIHGFRDRDNYSSATAMSVATRQGRSLSWYLASTQQQLAALPETRGAERAALLDAVIAQNRIYALAAERTGDQRLANALRSFVPILERLAYAGLDGHESDAEVSQLNFELRVMQARLDAAASTYSPRSAVL